MKRIALLLLLLIAAATAAPSAQTSRADADADAALRARIEARYNVVPMADGIALTPKNRRGDVRLIEITDVIAVNGTVVTGRELRDRLGADADTILRLSYLDVDARRALFPAASTPPPTPGDPPLETPAVPSRVDRDESTRAHRARGDRVRVLGDVRVAENEEVTGQVVAVLGSAYIDGEVGDQVVAVLGSVVLGPKAVVRGDIVSVGGRVRRTEGSQTRGGITEVSLANAGVDWPEVGPWLGAFGMASFLEPWGAVPRLLGSLFRLMLLLFLAALAYIIFKSTVERSAERVIEDPLKSTFIGLAAALLIGPVLFLVTLVLFLTIIGIPVVFIVMPFVLLFLIILAVVGFSGAAYAVGQRLRRRFGMVTPPGLVDVAMGVVLVLLPLLLGRIIALGGWALGPVAWTFIAVGIAFEFLAWCSGFGAVVTNGFGRWQARRSTNIPGPLQQQG